MGMDCNNIVKQKCSQDPDSTVVHTESLLVIQKLLVHKPYYQVDLQVISGVEIILRNQLIVKGDYTEQ